MREHLYMREHIYTIRAERGKCPTITGAFTCYILHCYFIFTARPHCSQCRPL